MGSRRCALAVIGAVVAVCGLSGCAMPPEPLDPGEHVPNQRLGAADDLGWSVYNRQQAVAESQHAHIDPDR
jgi:hypothetical protein